MTAKVTITGDKELQAKLSRLQNLEFLKPIITAAAQDVRGYIAQYPESSEANAPNERGRWYERGFGSKWRRADGSIGGRATSETLGRRWTTQSRRGGMAAVVGNNASYARWVQADEQQADFHRRRGWRTDAEAMRERGPEILRRIQRAVDWELRK